MNKIIGQRLNNKTTIIPTEHAEQEAVCDYLDANNIKYYAVPNGSILGGKNKWGQISKLKAEGVKKGVPDLVVLAKQKTIYIEMKRQKGGTISKEQKVWIDFINELPYAEAYVCRGASEAIEKLREAI